jgi:hypothetical protein
VQAVGIRFGSVKKSRSRDARHEPASRQKIECPNKSYWKSVELQKRNWLGGIPWEAVLNSNQALCHAGKTLSQLREKNCEAARRLWEESALREWSLVEALDICRKCCDFSPFVLHNSNTFAGLARKLVEDRVNLLPPVEGQIFRTTVAHYVAGEISRKELLGVVRHFEPAWATPAPAKSAAPAVPRMARIESRA